MIRQTKKIELVSYLDKVGFTVIYTDNTREHFLFSPETAIKLSTMLGAAARSMLGETKTITGNDVEITNGSTDDGAEVSSGEVPETNGQGGFHDGVAINDSATVGLVTGGRQDENDGKKIH